MIRPARVAAFVLALALATLAGCANPRVAKAPADVTASSWSGRLALQVAEHQSQSFSAGFELRGNAREGDLTLFTPIGGTLALLSWAPGSATLNNGGHVQQFESLDALVTHATGSAIPIAALFDWLRGVNTPVPGWEVDLAQLKEGRLHARRLQPPPEADLRVAIDH
jgi:outer membrane lipoprotein LolB